MKTSNESPLVARALARLREEGLAGLWLRTLRWLGVYRRYVLAGGPDEGRSPPCDVPVACARLEAHEIEEYLKFRPEQDRATILHRFDEGDWCFVGRCDGRIAVAIWIARDSAWLEFLSCRILLAERAFYLYDLFVVPEHRGNRVAGPVLAFRIAAMREAGYDRKVILNEPENPAALRRSVHHGNTVIAWLSCLQLGPWRRLRLHSVGDDAEPWVRLAD
ncbi:MAG: hypothetical protein JRG83_12350 [Deltaproteobacteria bacterium]|nr:hypothetical protein [Deltaproteobacteria bacterium]